MEEKEALAAFRAQLSRRLAEKIPLASFSLLLGSGKKKPMTPTIDFSKFSEEKTPDELEDEEIEREVAEERKREFITQWRSWREYCRDHPKAPDPNLFNEDGSLNLSL